MVAYNIRGKKRYFCIVYWQSVRTTSPFLLTYWYTDYKIANAPQASRQNTNNIIRNCLEKCINVYLFCLASLISFGFRFSLLFSFVCFACLIECVVCLCVGLRRRREEHHKLHDDAFPQINNQFCYAFNKRLCCIFCLLIGCKRTHKDT